MPLQGTTPLVSVPRHDMQVKSIHRKFGIEQTVDTLLALGADATTPGNMVSHMQLGWVLLQ